MITVTCDNCGKLAPDEVVFPVKIEFQNNIGPGFVIMNFNKDSFWKSIIEKGEERDLIHIVCSNKCMIDYMNKNNIIERNMDTIDDDDDDDISGYFTPFDDAQLN